MEKRAEEEEEEGATSSSTEHATRSFFSPPEGRENIFFPGSWHAVSLKTIKGERGLSFCWAGRWGVGGRLVV